MSDNRKTIAYMSVLLISGLCSGWCAIVSISGCGGAGTTKGGTAKRIVVFTALDDIYSRPIVRHFEERTGIAVVLNTDPEAAKTVGLVNRLLSRKEHPEADVFWNNEIAQTIVLKRAGVLVPYHSEAAKDIPEQYRDPDGYWTGFAARARVILYNRELLPDDAAPKTLEALAAPAFKDKLVIAKPLFGTTLTHAAMLFASWGPEQAKSWFRALQDNGVKIAQGNAMARNLVADGMVAVCLTDTDDANGAFMKGRPVGMIYPDQTAQGALVIPNTVALIKGGPNPELAKRFIDFILSAEVETMLARSESAQLPLRPGLPPHSSQFDPATIVATKVDWERVADQFETVREFITKDLKW